MSHDSSVGVLFFSGEYIGQEGGRANEDNHNEHNYKSDPVAGGVGALVARGPKGRSVPVTAH